MAKVTVYYGKDCSACHEEMEFLEDKGVAFTGRDVTSDADARKALIALGSRTVPTTIVDGTVVIGFEREKLRELLQI